MRVTLEKCIFLVGGLLMEQAPKAILLTDEMLEKHYEPALQDFKDLFVKDFEPPADFRQKVMDYVRWYLDSKRMRFGL